MGHTFIRTSFTIFVHRSYLPSVFHVLRDTVYRTKIQRFAEQNVPPRFWLLSTGNRSVASFSIVPPITRILDMRKISSEINGKSKLRFARKSVHGVRLLTTNVLTLTRTESFLRRKLYRHGDAQSLSLARIPGFFFSSFSRTVANYNVQQSSRPFGDTNRPVRITEFSRGGTVRGFSPPFYS